MIYLYIHIISIYTHNLLDYIQHIIYNTNKMGHKYIYIHIHIWPLLFVSYIIYYIGYIMLYIYIHTYIYIGWCLDYVYDVFETVCAWKKQIRAPCMTKRGRLNAQFPIVIARCVCKNISYTYIYICGVCIYIYRYIYLLK